MAVGASLMALTASVALAGVKFSPSEIEKEKLTLPEKLSSGVNVQPSTALPDRDPESAIRLTTERSSPSTSEL